MGPSCLAGGPYVPALGGLMHTRSIRSRKSQKGVEPWEAVKKWTAKVDLFEKKFIVVPINEE